MAWLTAVFGHEFYWIGLSDTEKEGQWQWDNGESVTYENWLPDDFFSDPLMLVKEITLSRPSQTEMVCR